MLHRPAPTHAASSIALSVHVLDELATSGRRHRRRAARVDSMRPAGRLGRPGRTARIGTRSSAVASPIASPGGSPMTTTTESAKALTADDMRDAEQVKRANASGKTPRRVHPRPVAAAEQLGPVGRRLRGGRLRGRSRPAGRTIPRRSPRRTPTRRCSPARPSARSPTTSRRSSGDSTRSRSSSATRSAGCSTQILAGRGPGRGLGRHRPGAVPRRAAAADLGAAVRVARCWRNPVNRHRAVPLTYEQFRYAFANAVERGRGASSCTRPSRCRHPGAPLFQAAAANLNPWTEAKVDSDEPGARSAADHLRREGPHRPVVDRQRLVQAAEAATRA